MKIIMQIMLLALCLSTSVAAESRVNYAEVDREMIGLMQLDPQQAVSYRQIMNRQRQSFARLAPGQWQQELALYRETFRLLEPVLSAEQHRIFVGVINSVIEFPENPELLARNN